MAATPVASPPRPSTSSGRPPARKRYLGVTIAGEANSPATYSRILGSLVGPVAGFRFRVVKVRRSAALVELPSPAVALARRAWNSQGARTYRTWGTLRKGKKWLASQWKT